MPTFYFATLWSDASQPLASLRVLVVALLMLSLAFGLWRLSGFALRIAIGWQCYVVVAFLVSLMSPTVWRMIALTEPRASSQALYLVALAASVVAKVVWGAVIIWFLIKRKSAFVKPATPPQAST